MRKREKGGSVGWRRRDGAREVRGEKLKNGEGMRRDGDWSKREDKGRRERGRGGREK